MNLEFAANICISRWPPSQAVEYGDLVLLLCMIKTKHGTIVDPGDVVTCATSGLHRFGGLGSGGGQSLMFQLIKDTVHQNMTLPYGA
jgi:hypothetical protein